MLELAPLKTELLNLRRERDVKEIKVRETTEIRGKKNMRYLEINIGQGGRYGQHLKVAALRAEEKAAQVIRVTGNIRGQKEISVLPCATVDSPVCEINMARIYRENLV